MGRHSPRGVCARRVCGRTCKGQIAHARAQVPQRFVELFQNAFRGDQRQIKYAALLASLDDSIRSLIQALKAKVAPLPRPVVVGCHGRGLCLTSAACLLRSHALYYSVCLRGCVAAATTTAAAVVPSFTAALSHCTCPQAPGAISEDPVALPPSSLGRTQKQGDPPGGGGGGSVQFSVGSARGPKQACCPVGSCVQICWAAAFVVLPSIFLDPSSSVSCFWADCHCEICPSPVVCVPSSPFMACPCGCHTSALGFRVSGHVDQSGQ